MWKANEMIQILYRATNISDFMYLDPANTSEFIYPDTEGELEGVQARNFDLYGDVQLQYSAKEHKKIDEKYKKLAGNFANKRQEDSANRNLAKKQKHVEGILYWMKQDYSATPVKTADELFNENANYIKLDNRVGTAIPDDLENTPERYLIFAPAGEAWYPDPKDPNYKDNSETQTKVLDDTYNEYVKENSQSSIVKTWTKEEDDPGTPAPHQIMEDWLLKEAGLYDAQKDRMIFMNTKPDVTRTSIKCLYNLVTRAPRCPVMMSFIRTVNFDTRLPNSWFERKHGRKMTAGDSVVLPVFMSTSNTNLSHSWHAHGPHSPGGQSDTRQPTANCCLIQVIVSKGTPMLPLGDFASNDHAHENEILLPPGIELVYLADDVFEMDVDSFVYVHTFITRISPTTR